MQFNIVTKYFKEYAKKQHKKQSFNNLMYDFDTKVYPYFCKMDIFDITERDILRWKDTIYSFNYSNEYNSKIYYIFSSFYEFLYLYYNIQENLVKKVGPFKKRPEIKKTDFYSLSEFKLFLKGFKDDLVYKSFFIFLFYSGCRPSEAMALKFSDVHGKYISINKSIERRGNRDFIDCKNIYSNRNILISKPIKKVLKVLKKYYGCDNDCFIFGCSRPLSPTSIDRHKKIACSRVGIRCITQHQFRHSFATYLISNGVAITTVSKLLGHSNIEITCKVYVHNNLLQEKRALQTLNSSFRFNI